MKGMYWRLLHRPNPPTGSPSVEQTEMHLLAVFLLNRLKCTYWQSLSLFVEQTKMHLLAACQSSC